MIHLHEGEAYAFLRVVQVARDVAEVEMNCTRVVETDLTITLKSNWSCLSQRIWSGLEEGNAASSRVIIVGGHNFESLMKPSKSCLNMKDLDWRRHAE